MKFALSIFYIILFYIIFGVVKIWHFFFRIVSIKNPSEISKVLYLASFYPGNAGFEYRVKKWSEYLERAGFKVTVKYIFSGEKFHKYRDNNVLIFQLIFLIRRFVHLFFSCSYHAVVVRRTILMYNEYGNLFFEKWLLAMHPNVILDFDDDMQLAMPERKLTNFGRFMQENRSKFYDSLKLYRKFMIGSKYLCDLVMQKQPEINRNQILIVPTCVDYHKFERKKYEYQKQNINFGWIGSDYNQRYLEIIIDPLNRIAQNNDVKLIMISGTPYSNPSAGFEIVNYSWSLETQIENLYKIDIGLMPLEFGQVEKGKCGFKLIQYMGIGIVSVATAVTANIEIINHGVDGFLVYGNNNWYEMMEKILGLKHQYEEISKAARKKIHEKYSFEAHFENYADFLKYKI